ncbi:serine protease inhibitor [Streptomyces sp. S1]|uniref:serine protease inhibitor n=1 Tax=Streptomyces sp. S1 TaxID=718288 RepID=UPI003D710C8C
MLLAALAAASATALIAPAAATAAPGTADATATVAPAVLDAAVPPARTTDPAKTKTEWPETLGLPKAWAERVIQRDRPDLEIVHVREGALVTMEYNEKRVRIVHNAFGLVAQVPAVG